MKKTMIIAAVMMLALTGCKEKGPEIQENIVKYEDINLVEQVYDSYDELAELIQEQMDSGWSGMTPDLLFLPDIFTNPEYQFYSLVEDLDENGYKELAIGLKVEGESRIYQLYSTSEEGKLIELFMTENGSYMVKEGAVYAVYPASGDISDPDGYTAEEEQFEIPDAIKELIELAEKLTEEAKEAEAQKESSAVNEPESEYEEEEPEEEKSSPKLDYGTYLFKEGRFVRAG